MASCEYLNPKGIKQIVDENFAGVRNHASLINRLLTHVIWNESLE